MDEWEKLIFKDKENDCSEENKNKESTDEEQNDVKYTDLKRDEQLTDLIDSEIIYDSIMHASKSWSFKSSSESETDLKDEQSYLDENSDDEILETTIPDDYVCSSENDENDNETKMIFVKFDPNKKLFAEWSNNYRKQSIENNLTECEMIEHLIDLMPKELRSIIKLFPKDVKWSVYSKRIEELFINEQEHFLTKKKYRDYDNFLQFFSEKIKLINLLNGDDLSDDEKRNCIYDLLDQNLKDLFEFDLESMKLYEFVIYCCKLEKSLGWICSKCKSKTHRSLNCPKKSTYLFSINPSIDVIIYTLFTILIISSVLFTIFTISKGHFIDSNIKASVVDCKCPVIQCPEVKCSGLDFAKIRSSFDSQIESIKTKFNQIDFKQLLNISNNKKKKFFFF